MATTAASACEPPSVLSEGGLSALFLTRVRASGGGGKDSALFRSDSACIFDGRQSNFGGKDSTLLRNDSASFSDGHQPNCARCDGDATASRTGGGSGGSHNLVDRRLSSQTRREDEQKSGRVREGEGGGGGRKHKGGGRSAAWSIKDFRVLSELGAGPHSTVFHVVHISTRIELALKCYFKSTLDAVTLREVKNEIRIQSSVSHPDITKAFGWFNDDEGNLFLLLELAKSGDLFDLIRDWSDNSAVSGPAESKACRTVIRPLASAVAHLHARGIMHRDIKAENLLVTDDKLSIKLADFGFALDYRQRLPSTRLGTLEYMAPEVLRCSTKEQRRLKFEGKAAAAYGPEVDCWAIGVLAYECLMGNAPYEADSLDEMLQLIDHGAVLLDPNFLQGKTPDAKDFIRRCMDANPATRLTAQAMLSHPWVIGHHPTTLQSPLPPALVLACHTASSPISISLGQRRPFSLPRPSSLLTLSREEPAPRPGSYQRAVSSFGGRWQERAGGEGVGASGSLPSDMPSSASLSFGLRSNPTRTRTRSRTLAGRFADMFRCASSRTCNVEGQGNRSPKGRERRGSETLSFMSFSPKNPPVSSERQQERQLSRAL
mmetsp:Transcript_38580/g.95812  ORF Transcript_38580/g.95812 Transcript_38580/m.95812 type:complete len:602 (-) Transcript_38580:227-2032(-)